jgi:ABC-type histidine transport system ATPase subunit
MSLVVTDGIEKTYGEQFLLRGVSLVVGDGDRIGLVMVMVIVMADLCRLSLVVL